MVTAFARAALPVDGSGLSDGRISASQCFCGKRADSICRKIYLSSVWTTHADQPTVGARVGHPDYLSTPECPA